MALHFDIMVNREPIGRVVAQRMALINPDGPNDYIVEVEYPLGTVKELKVQHYYDDGALVLIAHIMGAAAGRIVFPVR